MQLKQFLTVVFNYQLSKTLTYSTLDYDSMVEKYVEFTLTATDGGSPQLSGTVPVRVWVENVNDQEPVMNPGSPQQTWVTKENRITLIVLAQPFASR